MQNPNPRTFNELSLLLDSRNEQHGILGNQVLNPLPNEHMHWFPVRSEAIQAAKDMAAIDRLSDGQCAD